MVKAVFWILAILLSFFTARHMVKVHGAGIFPEESKKKEWLHDHILNFIGTFLGWVAAYYFLFFRLGKELGLTDILLIFLSFVGITGYLPHLIINKGLKP